MAQEGESSSSSLETTRQPEEPTPASPAHLGGTPAPAGSQSTPERSRKRSLSAGEEEEEEEAKKRDLGKEEEEEVVSSAPSSPLCEPCIAGDPEIYDRFRYPDVYRAFEAEEDKFQEALVRQTELPTLKIFGYSTCLSNDPNLLPIRELGTRAVLRAAKFLLRLSSFLDDKPLQSSSGFWIEWDQENKTGIVLTTAHLLRSKCPSMDHWLGKDQYVPHAKVIVHLLNDTTTEGHLLYHQEHYDLAFFRLRVDQPVQLPSFDCNIKCAQEVFMLGRDEFMKLRITSGRVEYLNPSLFHRYHYIYVHRTDCKDRHNKYDDGGPVIDLDGNVVGIINNTVKGSFMPTSILVKCLDLFRKHRCIPRLHLGLKFSAIELLDPAHVEWIWRKCHIDHGLIIKTVSSGSLAEKLGICRGDVLYRLDGKDISTTVELEKMLLDICLDCFGTEIYCNDKVNISIEVFDVRQVSGGLEH
ncbi:uncharacterized protein LOC100822609 [Brachypodium distachyon]|uniref:PDZ domain-containing protein n=1 Tax=Brachypodium distachyon TaxID=15368 RepID=I1H3T9_BRADI|nr:uncharacterized protein LOC100822609 [Brachypodium distachyon]KQK20949.1 hypothetical protein BRADI_1g57710v3 [Brachypodium distachyon]PNT77091.1 hypothetical protein BRADI_1g57710v3 [Brachypodium distachyon]PNT77092.1 hypothetical protein BRADI_1g57710v3 [Brachypodium distachyon]PNT77093.1 hypothetical protein BRADI_1g57710v3 [Brachypodium distachyon]|eukprot:XP_024314204.1 uncharacterized protein LOC100822609 [Brachypodium distachyon]